MAAGRVAAGRLGERRGDMLRLGAGAAVAVALAAALVLLAEPASAQPGSVKYVAVGASAILGPCTIGYSYDGTTWQAANFASATGPCWGVGYNGTHWVAAQAGRVWVSTDGINYQTYTTPMTTTTWGGVTWGDGRWIVAGGTSQVITSTDGINWSFVTYPAGIGNILGTTYNGDTWMNSGNTGIAFSPDGLAWTAVGTGGLSATPNARAQIHHNDRWWVAANTPGGTTWSANNGASWTLGTYVPSITKLASDGMGTVVAVGSGGQTWSSTDGMNTWSAGPSLGAALYGLTYGDCLFVAAGYSGRIATSADGVAWTLHAWPWGGTAPVHAVATSGLPGCGPSANDDSFTFNEDQPARTLNVLDNDLTGMSGSPFSIVSHTMPTKGTLTGPVAGTFAYVPLPDVNGDDSFEYTIQDLEGKSSTATVDITINAVNDAPWFTPGAPFYLSTPADGPQEIAGWATDVKPAPPSAADESAQSVVFVLTTYANAAMFSSTPTLQRSGSAADTNPIVPPTSGSFGVLKYAPSGASGRAQLCFRVVDSGGADTVVNSWGESATGSNLGPTGCVEIEQNAPPLAYFEPSSPVAAPGRPVTFDSCPGPVPRCSFDADDTLANYLWEFGDGMSSSLSQPTHTYATTGAFKVRLTVWDTRGSTATYERELPVQWADGAPDDQAAAPPAPPVADAGRDLTVLEGTLVQLSGTQSGGGTDTEFRWTQTAGPDVLLSDVSAAAPTFRAPLLPTMAPVTLQFELVASWQGAEGAPDHVVVHVVSANRVPVADAGDDVEVRPADPITLDGSRSTDPDGDPVTYRWEQVLAPGAVAVQLSDPAAASPTFQAPAHSTTLQFRLTVADAKSASQDTVTVVVAPRLDAHEGAKAEPPAPVPLQAGTAHARSDGSDLLPVLLGGAGFLALAILVVVLLLSRRR